MKFQGGAHAGLQTYCRLILLFGETLASLLKPRKSLASIDIYLAPCPLRSACMNACPNFPPRTPRHIHTHFSCPEQEAKGKLKSFWDKSAPKDDDTESLYHESTLSSLAARVRVHKRIERKTRKGEKKRWIDCERKRERERERERRRRRRRRKKTLSMPGPNARDHLACAVFLMIRDSCDVLSALRKVDATIVCGQCFKVFLAATCVGRSTLAA
eukprot:1159940-Pelagomonas_calceolata.AAC.17